MVVRVADEDQIGARFGQQGIVDFAQDHLDVREPALGGRALDVLDHVRVDVHGVDPALGADRLGQIPGEVPVAGPQVGDLLARSDRERRDDCLRLLPGVPRGAAGAETQAEAKNEDRGPETVPAQRVIRR